MLENLRNIQVKALRVVTRAFRATTKSALNIEAYVLSIKQRLEKFINNIMLCILVIPLYKNIINKRFKKRKRRQTSLKTLTFRFRNRTEIRLVRPLTGQQAILAKYENLIAEEERNTGGC